VCSPFAGIVPCIGFFDPKPGFPPANMEADENALLPSMPKKYNGKEPIDVVLEEGPSLLALDRL
jgi:hypothetical protein